VARGGRRRGVRRGNKEKKIDLAYSRNMPF
jgi:hypothetical protein